MAESNTKNSAVANSENSNPAITPAPDKKAKNPVREKIDQIVDQQESGQKSINLAKPKKPGDKLKPLKITLAVFAGVIVILVITILAINRPWENSESSSSCNGTSAEEIAAENAAKRARIQQFTNELLDATNGMTTSEAITYLDAKIEEYAGTEYEFSTRLVKIYLLLNATDNEAALAEAEKINPEDLESEQALDYYSAMWKIYDALGESDLSLQYQEMFAALYNFIYSEETDE